MHDFKTNYTEDYMDLITDFETKKRTLTDDMEGKMTLRVPVGFTECCRKRNIDIHQKIEDSKWKDVMKLQREKLRVDKSVVRSLFEEPLNAIIDHVKSLFEVTALQEVDLILLVGGFSESVLVQSEFRSKFQEKKLLIPKDPGATVLNGAVRFGHLPDLIQSRVARYSFGREGWPEFNAAEHDGERKTTYLGKDVCKGVFWKMVNIGDDLPGGKVVSETIPGSVDQTGAHIAIFCSADSSTKYVTEESCKFLGEILVKLPESDNPKDKNIKLSFTFGDTELKVHVKIPYTGVEYETNIDF